MAVSSSESTWEALGVKTCVNCNLKTSNLGFLQAHNCSSATISYNTVNCKYFCSLCHVGLTETLFEEHLELHLTAKPYACSCCKLLFRTREEVHDHAQKEHVADSLASKAGDDSQPWTLLVQKKTKDLMLRAKVRRKSFFKPTSAKYVSTPFAATAPNHHKGPRYVPSSPSSPTAPKPAVPASLKMAQPIVSNRQEVAKNDRCKNVLPNPAPLPSLPSTSQSKRTFEKNVHCEVQVTTGAVPTSNRVDHNKPQAKNCFKSLDKKREKINDGASSVFSRSCTGSSERKELNRDLVIKSEDFPKRLPQKGIYTVFKDGDSFLMLMRGEFYCLRCHQKWSEALTFINHIASYHLHDSSSTCCKAKPSLKCGRLQSILKSVRDCSTDKQLVTCIDRFIIKDKIQESELCSANGSLGAVKNRSSISISSNFKNRHQVFSPTSLETANTSRACLKDVEININNSLRGVTSKDLNPVLPRHLCPSYDNKKKGNGDEGTVKENVSLQFYTMDASENLESPRSSNSTALIDSCHDTSKVLQEREHFKATTSKSTCLVSSEKSHRAISSQNAGLKNPVASDRKKNSSLKNTSLPNSTSLLKCLDKENNNDVTKTTEWNAEISEKCGVGGNANNGSESTTEVKSQQQNKTQHVKSEHFTPPPSNSNNEISQKEHSPPSTESPSAEHRSRSNSTEMATESLLSSFYQCGFFDCVFSSHLPVDLLVHNATAHSQEEEIPCVYCGQICRTATGLLEHMDTHVGQNGSKAMYSCSLVINSKEICIAEHRNLAKVFSILKNVKEKKTMSSTGANDIRYRCKLCLTDFHSVDELKGHLSKSLLKVVACRYCRGHFLDSLSWTRHMAKEHPSEAKLYRINEKLLCKQRRENMLRYVTLASKRKEFRSNLYQQQMLTLNQDSEVQDSVAKETEKNDMSDEISNESCEKDKIAAQPVANDLKNTNSALEVERVSEVKEMLSSKSSDACVDDVHGDSTGNCGKSESDSNEVEVEDGLDWDEVSMPIYYKCKICRCTKFPSYSLALKHQETHSDSTANICCVQNSSFEHAQNYKCSYCGYTCANDLSVMEKHLRCSHKYLKCGYCDNTYAFQHHIENHLRYHHNGQERKIVEFYPEVQHAFVPLNNEEKEIDNDELEPPATECTKHLINLGSISRKRHYEVANNASKKRRCSDDGELSSSVCPVNEGKTASYVEEHVVSKEPTVSGSEVEQKNGGVVSEGINTRMDPEEGSGQGRCAEKDAFCSDQEGTCMSVLADNVGVDMSRQPPTGMTKTSGTISNDSECYNRGAEETRIRTMSSSDAVTPEEIHVAPNIDHSFRPNTGMDSTADSTLPQAPQVFSGNELSRICPAASQPAPFDQPRSCPQPSCLASKPDIPVKLKEKSAGLKQKVLMASAAMSTAEYPFMCTSCNVCMKSIENVLDHMRWLHPNQQQNGILYDRRTELMFTKEGLLLGKEPEELPQMPVQRHLCLACIFRSSLRSDVEAHIKLEHPEKDLQKCILTLHLETSYSQDGQVHHTDIMDPCTSTSVSTLGRDDFLAQHQPGLSSDLTIDDFPTAPIQPAPRPSLRYSCHLCDEVSFNEFLYKLHLARHDGFSCTSVLSSKSGHLRCSECGYIAGSNNDLAEHIAKHPMERRFACSICDVDSHTKGGLAAHIRKYHSDNPDVRLIDRKEERSAVEIKPKIVDLDPMLRVEDINMMDPRHLTKLLRQSGINSFYTDVWEYSA